MKSALRLLVIASSLFATTLAQAQSYPDRPVKLLVPLAAASAVDIVARVVGDKMGTILGQRLYVENQPGAAGMIGMRAVAHSAPDGYTIVVANDSVLTMIPNVKSDAGYDPQKDFVPVARLANIPLALIATPSFPAKNIEEMIALAKDKPGVINYASGGIGSPQHIAIEVLMRSAGIQLTHVPYRGITPAVAGIVAGDVPLGFTAVSAVFPLLADNRVKLLGVSTAQRLAQAPDLPTISEGGLPGYSFVAWCAMFAPANTPPDVVKKLNAAALQAMKDPDVQKRLVDLGFQIAPGTPEELGAYLRVEYQRTGDLIRAANIKVE
ncbi:MAG: tripartite tricarboxylate transporter substrate binding protein [Pseudolabrys sp.]